MAQNTGATSLSVFARWHHCRLAVYISALFYISWQINEHFSHFVLKKCSTENNILFYDICRTILQNAVILLVFAIIGVTSSWGFVEKRHKWFVEIPKKKQKRQISVRCRHLSNLRPLNFTYIGWLRTSTLVFVVKLKSYRIQFSVVGFSQKMLESNTVDQTK